MKLRNKKTGQIVRLTIYGINLAIDNQNQPRYYSLSKLNEDWEDYELKEPLIKDEKIRKAVRAWAEANDLDRASYYRSSHYWYLRAFNENEAGIDFWLNYPDIPNLIESKSYTIAELCGEEE